MTNCSSLAMVIADSEMSALN